MAPEITKLLTDCTKDVKSNLDILMQYLDENLCMLSNELTEDIFKLIHHIMVDKIATIMLNLIQNDFEVIYLQKHLYSLSNDFYHFLTEKETTVIFLVTKRMF